MKTLILATLAATLILAAEEKKALVISETGANPGPTVFAKAPELTIPNALTPEQSWQWKEFTEKLKATFAASEKAELAYLRAKDENQRVFAEAKAALAKWQGEAKCPACMPQAQPDGSFVWPKLVTDQKK